MTVEEIRQAIMGAIAASLATAIAIAWPNHSFTPPQGSWIRPVIKMGSSYIGELGDDGIGQRTGVLMVSTFTMPDTGLILANTFVDRIENIFRRADLSGVIFDEPSSTDLGLDVTQS